MGPRPAWRDIEVHRDAGGWTGIQLSGLAADLAAEAGIEQVAVSLTHEEPLAAALVVGVCRSRDHTAPSVKATDAVTASDRREE
jgi:holo-[acyl-carrier protein] synthase